MKVTGWLACVLVLASPLAADTPTGPCASTPDDQAGLTLVYTGSRDVIRLDGKPELRELSGVALQPDPGVPSGVWTWLIDDDKRNLYRVDADGHVGGGDENKITLRRSRGSDLEGLAFRRDGRLYAVQEGERRIVRVDISPGGGRRVKVFPLSDMKGFHSVTAANDPRAVSLATYLSRAPADLVGLEGIAYFRAATVANQGQGSFFVVNQGNPGLLIEIDGDLERILGFTVLNCGTHAEDCPACTCPDAKDLPFGDRVDVGGAVRDFSGLSYDGKRERLWIASDAATAVYLYDVAARTHIAFPLYTVSFDACIQQAEGVAYLESLDALRVVGDRKDSAKAFHFHVVER